MYWRILLVLVIVSFHARVHGQNMYVQNFTQKQYGSNDYTTSPQNWDIEQDSLGRMYIANSSGILVFDGLKWYLVQGTENMELLTFAKDANNRLYAGGKDLGFLKQDQFGNVVFESLLKKTRQEDSDFGQIGNILAIGNDVYFRSFDNLIVYKDDSLHQYEVNAKNYLLANIDGKAVIQDNAGNILCLNGEGLDTLFAFGAESPNFVGLLRPSNTEDLILFSEDEEIYKIQRGQLVRWPTELDKLDIHYKIKEVLHYPEYQLYALPTRGAGILVLNYQGHLVKQIGIDEGFTSNICYSLFRDRNGELWATFDNGIARLEYPSAMYYFNYTDGLDGIVLCALEAKDQLYTGTTDGLFALIGDQFQQIADIDEVWDLKSIGGTNWVAASSGLYTVADNQVRKVLDEATRTVEGATTTDILWVGLADGLGFMVKKGSKWSWKGRVQGVDHQVRFIAHENDSTIWVSFENLSRVSFNTELDQMREVQPLSEENGFTEDFEMVESYRINSRVRFGTAIGIYTYDAERQSLVADGTFGDRFSSGRCDAFALTEDEHKNVWLTSNRTNGKLVFEDDKYIRWDTLAYARLKSTDAWRIVPIENSPIVYFCTTDGLFCFDQSIKKNYDIPYNTLINKIELNRDSVISNFETRDVSFNEEKAIDYTFNDLRFSYTATTYNYEENMLFSHYLENYDDRWSAWEPAATKEYTNLPPGKYIFRVKAKNLYGVESAAAEYGFAVKPPWYRTTWAYSIFGALLISGLVFTDRYQRKRLFKKQQARIERQQEKLKREREISNKLRKVDRLKDEFLANTSHELRTPLNGIIGISESLYEDAGAIHEGELKMNLGMVIASGKRLASLVDSLLDYSKLKTQNLEIRKRPVDLKSIVKMVLTMSRPLISSDRLQLVNDIPDDLPLVEADENRLQQILYNLVGNAIKFSEKGQIKVSATLKEKDVEIVVADEGVGIPPDKIDKIFDSYEQLHSEVNREYIGTGLGLAITKKLVELHGGKIRVESKKDVGSRFSFTIAASLQESPKWSATHVEEEHPTTPTAEIREIDNARFSVLIVDDEPVNRQVLINHLKNEPYYLEVASNGSEALKLIDQRRYDLILLDVMMPKMSGFEVCMKIRERYMLSELPVIFITAKGQIIDLVEGLKYGGNDYITKPFSKQEFLARIKTHLNLFKINDSYSRFVPHEFLQSLGRESIMDVNLGDQIEKEVTILFSDIRDYTSLSEKMTPMENFNFLNAILSKMGPIIRENDGFVMQYLGDGLMSIFPHEPIHAVSASIAMSQQLEKYNSMRISKSRNPVQIGFGLHTGRLVLGVIGDEKRMDVNVVSDSVNTASRMEGLTKYYGTSIIMSETTLAKLPEKHDIDHRFLGMVRLKGKSVPLKIYEVLDGLPAMERKLKADTKTTFEEGLQRYFEKDFINAATAFKKVAAANEADISAQIYLKHAAKLMVEKVPENWTGVETMKLK